MPAVKVLGQCLLLLVVLANDVHSSPLPVTCQAGIYATGKPASVTCNFNMNVPVAKRDVSITRYLSPTDTGSDVLLCNWINETEKLDCTAYEGFTFDSIIQNRVKVTIPAVSSDVAGFYKCYFVSSNKTDAQLCELTLERKRSGQNHTDTVSAQEIDGNPKTIVAVVASLFVVALVLCIVGCVVCRLCRNSVGHCWATCLGRNREGGEPEEALAFIPPQYNQIKKRLQTFELSTKTLKRMMNILDQEMNKGLNDSTRAQADVKMYPVYCHVPDKLDLGDYLMVDVGSTCVKVSDVKLRNKGVMVSSDSYPFDPEMKSATGEQIFDFIVSAIDWFVKNQNKPAKQMKSVLVFHFPCHHEDMDKASIAKWTKEFCCEGVVDQDLNELLQMSIRRRKPDLKLKVVAIVNSAVNTLISAVCHNPRCMISLVVGNGFNASYVDNYQKEETGGAEVKGSYEIYNTELGALGEIHSLDFLRTAYDKVLDNTSKKPGSQILEKMVSWTYIGEIVRLALKDLRKDELVLTDAPEIGGPFKEGVFTANHVATIDKDMSENCGETTDILRTFGVLNPTEADLNTVKYICRLVTERAASLAAASLATLITRLNRPDIVIVVDGELNRHIPRFHDLMYNKTRELVKPELRDKFYLVSSLSEGCIGAVRMAVAALSKQNAAAADT